MQTKYIVKFTNGYWKVFNNHTYEDVSIHGLYSEAMTRCTQQNSKS